MKFAALFCFIAFLATPATALETFYGIDPGAGAGSPRPNSDLAASGFAGSAGALGPIMTIDFEDQPFGDFVTLPVFPGVLAELSGTTNEGGILPNNVDSATLGYNTTFAGQKHVGVWPIFNVGTCFVRFSFSTPIQAFGAYLTGLGTANGDLVIEYMFGAPQTIPVEGASVGGVLYVGFTEPGAMIATITLRLNKVFGSRDIFGVDDVSFVHKSLNQPPDCSSASAVHDEFWPPNHRLVPVGIAGVTDPDGDPVTITITGVTQDEPLDGEGDGHTCPDAVLAGAEVELRAERSGLGNGRVYHVSFMADDGQGGTCEGTVTVCVPHDRGHENDCVDDGPSVDSTAPCDPGLPIPGDGLDKKVEIQLTRGAHSVATIEYSLAQEAFVQLSIFDVSGRRISTLVDQHRAAGTHRVTWNGQGSASGIYFVRLKAGDYVETKSVLHLK